MDGQEPCNTRGIRLLVGKSSAILMCRQHGLAIFTHIVTNNLIQGFSLKFARKNSLSLEHFQYVSFFDFES